MVGNMAITKTGAELLALADESMEKTALFGLAGKALMGAGSAFGKAVSNAVTGAMGKMMPAIGRTIKGGITGSTMRSGVRNMSRALSNGQLNQNFFNSGLKQFGKGVMRTGLTYGVPTYVAGKVIG